MIRNQFTDPDDEEVQAMLTYEKVRPAEWFADSWARPRSNLCISSLIVVCTSEVSSDPVDVCIQQAWSQRTSSLLVSKYITEVFLGNPVTSRSSYMVNHGSSGSSLLPS